LCRLSEPGREECRPARIINARTLYTSYPDPVLIIGVDTIDMVIQKRGGISYYIPENMEPVTVIPVQPVIGPEPHKTVVILIDTGYGIVRKALVDAQIPHGKAVGSETMPREKKETAIDGPFHFSILLFPLAFLIVTDRTVLSININREDWDKKEFP
jgi:hypothetical protein